MKNKLFTLSVLSAMVFVSQLVNAQDLNVFDFYTSTDLDNPYSSVDAQNKPWSGNSHPDMANSATTSLFKWAGFSDPTTGDVVSSSNNEGIISFKNSGNAGDRFKGHIAFADAVKGKTLNLNLNSTRNGVAYFYGFQGAGGTIKFSTSNSYKWDVYFNSTSSFANTSGASYKIELTAESIFHSGGATFINNVDSDVTYSKTQIILKNGVTNSGNGRFTINKYKTGIMATAEDFNVGGKFYEHRDLTIERDVDFTFNGIGLNCGSAIKVEGNLTISGTSVINDFCIIDLGEDSTGTITFNKTLTLGASDIHLVNFRNEAIYLGQNLSGDISQFKVFNGTDWVSEVSLVDGYLFSDVLPQVPEPAEWAAIFGAVALGFAMYRRRK